MTATSTKQWGLTPALSVARPNDADLKQNAELIEELKRENNYEGQAETQKRMATLKILKEATQELVRVVSRKKGHAESQIAQYGGKVVPYGSYRLGVYGPGSDIDTLAVAPQHVTREDFFDYFPAVLERLAPPKAISSLTSVPDSFVPIIKLVLNNIEIDLIFVAIASQIVIPEKLNLGDNKLLDGLDPSSLRAITGPRVTDEILSLVPEQKTFRTALRAIKLWAQRRAIYANIVGYPGGVAWAMIVARVCQMYPHAIGATIVDKVFFIMKSWPWPSPIMLKDIEAGQMKTWNPKIYTGDAKNIMPIITPAYPSMCATYNISKSGKFVIQREIERGFQITKGIFEGKLNWSDLFKKHTFFTSDHKYYLAVITGATNKDASKAWSGLVESKVRLLVMQLELLSDIITLARPFTKGFKRVHKCVGEAQAQEVRRGKMDYKVEETETVETTDPELVTTQGEGAAIPDADNSLPEISAGKVQTLHTVTFYIGLDVPPNAKKQLNISSATDYFKGICTSWVNFKEGVHSLETIACKSHDLPDDLFDTKAGEVKPSRAPKKKVLKRSFAEVDDSTTPTNGTQKRQTMTPNGTPAPISA